MRRTNIGELLLDYESLSDEQSVCVAEFEVSR